MVRGIAYRVGYGDPGKAADGEENNCLIDSLRQCLSLHSDRLAVREDLKAAFANAAGRARVTHTSYLDVGSHWQDILQSLFRHNTDGRPPDCDPREYCVIALCIDRPDHGTVLGDITAPNLLVVLNHHDMHFDPCLRCDRIATPTEDNTQRGLANALA